MAVEVAETFRVGKEMKRETDLMRELLLVHLDGTGDGQYATLINGYISVPANPGEKLRVQWNLLKPITENMVRHHTSIPFRCQVDSPPDRRARDKARVAQAYGNHVIQTQRLNQVWSEALWSGAPYGHGIVHVNWRYDLAADLYTPLWVSGEDAQKYGESMRPGYADFYCGDPWNTVYNAGATRNSVHRITYARSFPTALLKNRFGHIPGVQALAGRTDLPSASRYQRAVRRAMVSGMGVHGSTAVTAGFKAEEITILICDEMAPGMDPQWPRGRLTLVALSGVADVEENPQAGTPVLLHQGPLPGGRFGVVRVYPGGSFDDVLGSPWLSDLDDLQVGLNQLATLRRERIRRFARTQMLAQSGSLEDDSLLTVDDAILYYTGNRPEFLTPPTAEVGLVDNDIRDTMETMFRVGGWQAASRGEGKAGDAAAKVVALAKADDSIFSTANLGVQMSVCDGLQIAHGLARRYMTVPQMLKVTGEDLIYLAEPWVRSDDLADEPPAYLLTQGSASPDAKLQQLLNLVSAKGADGVPLMTTEEFHRNNPDPSLRPQTSEVRRIKRSRPFMVNAAIVRAVETFEEQMGGQQINPQQEAMLAQAIHQQIGQQFRLEQGDDPQANIDALDELILDETASGLAREVARQRRALYAQWQAQLIAYQQQYLMAQQQGAPTQQQQPNGPTANAVETAGFDFRSAAPAAA